MLKRSIEAEVRAFLKIMPVVLVIGARQTGKTTLMESLMQENGWHYVTFDDQMALSLARQAPASWLDSLPKPLIIDEVQRLPEIFLSIKRDVDKNKEPGRYLLTGSANPLLLPNLGDSLAGRTGVLTLYPLSQGEIRQKKEHFLEHIFSDKVKFVPVEPENDFYGMILRGGFPSLLKLEDLEDANRWIRSYLQTMLERDVRDISNIQGLRDLPRLFQLLATRSANLLNVSELSRTIGLVNVTLQRYLRLLETVFFIHTLPAWSSNLGKRLTRSPKIHVCDTAVMAQLLDIDEVRLKSDPNLFGQFLESFVFAELMKQKSWSSIHCQLFHFRDLDKEVDFIIERTDGSIVGVEVKSSKQIHTSDLKGLLYLKERFPNFRYGVIFYLGKEIQFLGEKLVALPLEYLWH